MPQNRPPTAVHTKPSKYGTVLAVLYYVSCFAVSPADGQDQEHSRYMIVVTGSELLDGVYADQHTYFLTRTLRPLGWRCVGSVSVDDRPDDIKQALQFATGKAPMVIVTGGLGPTDTDITRTALAGFAGVALREHPDLLHELERRFQTPRAELRDNLRRQAQVPVGGSYLHNRMGTAAGLVYQFPRGVIVALPGPPRELRPMVRNELIPYLNRRFGTRLPGSSLTLRFVGIGQSRINQTLKEQSLIPNDVLVTTQFANGRVDYTFSLPADTSAQRKQLETIRDSIRKQLGDYIYGSGSTSRESHILARLKHQNQTLAIAEVGTAGELARSLSSATDKSHSLAGAYVAPTDNRLSQILRVSSPEWKLAKTSTEKARQLVRAVAQQSTTTWAVAVGAVRREESVPAQLTIAIRTPDGQVETHNLRFTGSLGSSQARLCTSILDRLWRKLR